MAIQDVIQNKLDTLLDIMITDGVQPSDLANNIFLNEYKQVSYIKRGDYIIGEITLSELEDCKESFYVLRYYYTHGSKIERIEEEKHGNIVIHWDRAIAEAELINDIVLLLRSIYSNLQLERFLKTLPKSLSEKLEIKINEVA